MVTPRDPRRHKRSAPALVPARLLAQSGVGPCRADRDTTYGDAGRRRAFEARARSPQRLSSQLVRHRGDAGHGAFLVAFGTRSLTPSTPIVSLPTDSRLCGFALSACKNTRHRLARSKTATDALLPFASHCSKAATAIARSCMRTAISRKSAG